MFVAKVLVCYLFSTTDCLEAHDVRGPYATFDRCEARVSELIEDIRKEMPDWEPVGWKCELANDKIPT